MNETNLILRQMLNKGKVTYIKAPKYKNARHSTAQNAKILVNDRVIFREDHKKIMAWPKARHSLLMAWHSQI